MAKKQTSFSIEDAEIFLKELQELRETLQQEWSRVLNQWSNLKTTWHDEQFDKFAPLFDKLAASYDVAKLEAEVYINYLTRQIETAQKRRINLDFLEKPMAAAKIVSAVFDLGMMIASPPPPNPTPLSQKPDSSYVQYQDPNSCSLEDKIDPEQSLVVEQYESLPDIAKVMKPDDQLEKIYEQQKETEVERRKKKLEIVEDQEIAAGSPPPD